VDKIGRLLIIIGEAIKNFINPKVNDTKVQVTGSMLTWLTIISAVLYIIGTILTNIPVGAFDGKDALDHGTQVQDASTGSLDIGDRVLDGALESPDVRGVDLINQVDMTVVPAGVTVTSTEMAEACATEVSA